jgi:hypothetical protein
MMENIEHICRIGRPIITIIPSVDAILRDGVIPEINKWRRKKRGEKKERLNH